MNNVDFLNILTFITVFFLCVLIVDFIIKKFSQNKSIKLYNSTINFSGRKKIFNNDFIFHYAKSLFPVFFAVLIVRSFVFQPYKVPTGSLEPTVMPGDFIFVTQFNYGLRVPIIDKKFFGFSMVRRGDIVLFAWPVNKKATFVKRVIGLPNDRISYIDKIFYINGKKMKQKFVSTFVDNAQKQHTTLEKYSENLMGVVHQILINPERPAEDFNNLTVPDGMYFMVGDNRDNSDDSRDWGFVSYDNLIGRAAFVWLSIIPGSFKVNWERIGTILN